MSTFVELYGDLLDTELGSADRTELFTTVRRKAAINAGQAEFARLTGCLPVRGTIAVVDATAEYGLEAAFTSFRELAQDPVELLTNDGTTDTWFTGDDFVRRDIVWLDQHEPGWRTASAGTPMAYYVREGSGEVYLGLYPAPDIPGGETWTLYVTYQAQPTDMSLDADVPYTLSSNAKVSLAPWHIALVHFAASRLEKLRRNYAIEDRQRQLFASYVADYLSRKGRRPGGQRVSLARNYYRMGAADPDPYSYP